MVGGVEEWLSGRPWAGWRGRELCAAVDGAVAMVKGKERRE